MTTATIVKFVTRADAGLRQPRSISRNIAPQEGGTTIHYAGSNQRVSNLLSGHTRCVNLWRGYQNYHMDSRGFADVAYTGAFCQHGYAFAGRGAGIRTGANGTNAGNYRYYAVVWIGGEGETPTREALNAMAWWIRDLRRAGAAGMRVVPHSFHKGTACPGDSLRSRTDEFDNKDITGDAPMAHKHFDQMVLGANTVDCEAGRVAAARWDAAVGLIKADGSIEVAPGHPDAGREATAGFAWLVGSAADTNHAGQFADGVIRFKGDTRYTTAGKIGEAIEQHPKGSIQRAGRPW